VTDFDKEYQELVARIQEAMYNGDQATLDEIAGCRCCCDEHTFEDCLARIVGNCRGQGTLTRLDIQKWAEHYGMTLDQFYGGDSK
jgi:hypothetical protein